MCGDGTALARAIFYNHARPLLLLPVHAYDSSPLARQTARRLPWPAGMDMFAGMNLATEPPAAGGDAGGAAEGEVRARTRSGPAPRACAPRRGARRRSSRGAFARYVRATCAGGAGGRRARA